MTHGITRRQSQLLAFIAVYSAEHGYPPTYAEMATEMGVASKSSIFEFLNRLEERGHITRVSAKRQSLCVIETEAVRHAVQFRSLSRETSAARPEPPRGKSSGSEAPAAVGMSVAGARSREGG